MYAFLRRPIWILSHVLIAVLVVALIGLGFWQRARWLDEKGKAEALEQRAAQPAVPLSEVVDPDADAASVDPSVRFTKVVVSGVYDIEAEVAIRNRSQGGNPGAWVLTPLVQDDGTAVPVIRGWIPYDPAGMPTPFEGAEPPEGEVVVVGNVQLTQQRGSFGAIDPAEGRLDVLSRVDLDRFEQQLAYPLAPAWVLLDQQEPAQSGPLPEHVEMLTDDPGQNFSYMVQWWIFAAIAAGGYPLVLRVVARNRARNDQVPIDDEAAFIAALDADGPADTVGSEPSGGRPNGDPTAGEPVAGEPVAGEPAAVDAHTPTR